MNQLTIYQTKAIPTSLFKISLFVWLRVRLGETGDSAPKILKGTFDYLKGSVTFQRVLQFMSLASSFDHIFLAVDWIFS